MIQEPTPSPVYHFGPFCLDVRQRTLLRDGVAVPLAPKAFDLLTVLVQRSGLTVAKDELLKEVWPDAFVEEGNLTVHISAVRKALGDGAGAAEAAYIETVPRHGYRFTVPVEIAREAPRALVIERHRETRIVREEIEETVRPTQLAWRNVAVAAVTLFVVAAAALAWRVVREPRSTLADPLRVTTFSSFTTGVALPAFAPDGERIAFGWTGPDDKDWSIYVKTIGNDPPLRLTSNPGNEGAPAWSPDGRRIAYLQETRNPTAVGIYTIGSLGGPERKLKELVPNRYFDLEWSPDGRLIAYAEKTNLSEPWDNFRSLAIFLLSVDTGQTRQLTFPDAASGDDRFAFSPDGQTLSFVRHQEAGATMRSTVFTVATAGGTPRRIHEEENWIGHVAWAGDGRTLIFTSVRDGGNKLFRLSLADGRVAPLPLADDAAYYPAVSTRGNRLAYVRLYGSSDLMEVELSAAAQPARPLLASGRSESAPAFSPDGKKLAFVSEGTGREELWMSDRDGKNAVAMTEFHASGNQSSSWSPDGREIAFGAERGPANSTGGVFSINVETRQVRRLADQHFSSPSWSRDGLWIYVTRSPQRGKYEIWKVSARGGPPVQVAGEGRLIAQESLDGKMLFFTKHAGGIWRMPVGGGTETEVVPGFPNPLRGFWQVVRDGIYLVEDENDRSLLKHLNATTGRRQTLATLPGRVSAYHCGLAASPDGRTVVYAQRTSRSASDILLVENFR